MPGLPGQENVFAPDQSEPNYSPNQGLPPLMSNDIVPVGQQPTPAPTPAQQDALLERTDTPVSKEAGSGRRFSMNPGQLGWGVGASDFNPNGFKPNESRSTQVGKYGSAPLFASSLAFPDAVIASRMQGIAKTKADLAAQMAKFNPAEGLEDVKAPEYRDDFQRGAMGSINEYKNNVFKLYGEEEGTRRMMNANTPEGQGIRERVSAWTTIARYTNQATDSSEKFMKDMAGGTDEYSKFMYDQAYNERHKLGVQAGNHDPVSLAKSLKVFTGTVSLDDQVRKDGVFDILKNAGTVEELVRQVRSNDPEKERLYRSGFVGIYTKKDVSKEDVVQAMVDRYYPAYSQYMSEDDMKKYFKALAGEMTEEKLTQSQISSPSGGSGSSKAAPNYRVEETVVAGGGRHMKYPTVTLYGESNDKAKSANPLTFRDGDKEVYMIGERAMLIGGNTYIYGKQAGMPRTAAQKAAVAKELDIPLEDLVDISADPESSKAKEVMQSFNKLFPAMAPLKGNEALLDGMGYDPERVKSELSAYAPRKDAPAFVDPSKPDLVNMAKAKGVQWDQAEYDNQTPEVQKAMLDILQSK
jgi:hypothetical protein